MFKYEDLTPSEKKYLCNGAGRKGWQGKLVPDLVFREAANRHDFDYWRGCTEKDRDKADERFMSNMVHCAINKDNGKKRALFFRFLYLRLAPIYYTAVTTFGGTRSLGGFYYASRKRSHRDLVNEMSKVQDID
jgi:hypothetical protein